MTSEAFSPSMSVNAADDDMLCGGDTQSFCLKWNNHRSTVMSVVDSLLEEESFVDVTISAEGRSIKAHRIILSACSPYFKKLFNESYIYDKSPVIVLNDVEFDNLHCLVEYMYKGEANVSQNMLPSFIRTAELLKIRGLADGINNGNDALPSPNLQSSVETLPVVLPNQQAFLPPSTPVMTTTPGPSQVTRPTTSGRKAGRPRNSKNRGGSNRANANSATSYSSQLSSILANRLLNSAASNSNLSSILSNQSPVAQNSTIFGSPLPPYPTPEGQKDSHQQQMALKQALSTLPPLNDDSLLNVAALLNKTNNTNTTSTTNHMANFFEMFHKGLNSTSTSNGVLPTPATNPFEKPFMSSNNTFSSSNSPSSALFNLFSSLNASSSSYVKNQKINQQKSKSSRIGFEATSQISRTIPKSSTQLQEQSTHSSSDECGDLKIDENHVVNVSASESKDILKQNSNPLVLDGVGEEEEEEIGASEDNMMEDGEEEERCFSSEEAALQSCNQEEEIDIESHNESSVQDNSSKGVDEIMLIERNNNRFVSSPSSLMTTSSSTFPLPLPQIPISTTTNTYSASTPPGSGLINPWTGEEFNRFLMDNKNSSGEIATDSSPISSGSLNADNNSSPIRIPHASDLISATHSLSSSLFNPSSIVNFISSPSSLLASNTYTTSSNTTVDPSTSIDGSATNSNNSSNNPVNKFECVRCSRSYLHHATLVRHQRYECGIKASYPCSMCGRKFKRRDVLKGHADKCMSRKIAQVAAATTQMHHHQSSSPLSGIHCVSSCFNTSSTSFATTPPSCSMTSMPSSTTTALSPAAAASLIIASLQQQQQFAGAALNIPTTTTNDSMPQCSSGDGVLFPMSPPPSDSNPAMNVSVSTTQQCFATSSSPLTSSLSSNTTRDLDESSTSIPSNNSSAVLPLVSGVMPNHLM